MGERTPINQQWLPPMIARRHGLRLLIHFALILHTTAPLLLHTTAPFALAHHCPFCSCTPLPLCSCTSLPLCSCPPLPLCSCPPLPLCSCTPLPLCSCTPLPLCSCTPLTEFGQHDNRISLHSCAFSPILRAFTDLMPSRLSKAGRIEYALIIHQNGSLDHQRKEHSG